MDAQHTQLYPGLVNTSPASFDGKAQPPSAPMEEDGHVHARRQLIKINVGGSYYITSQATLCKQDSMLKRLVETSIGVRFFVKFSVNTLFQSHVDESGFIFIDRNGQIFAKILDYLRDGIAYIKTDEEARRLAAEADFYNLPVRFFVL